MLRYELGKKSPKQLVAEEAARWLARRMERLQRTIICDENLLAEEKAALTILHIDLAALESIIADELYRLDTATATTMKEIERAKRAVATGL
jgi:hypothetical protein